MPRRSIWSARQRAARFDRSSEGQHCRMAGLSLLAAIVIYWNTAHLGEAVRQRKLAGQAVNPELLPTSCSLANTGSQSVDSGLSVRFCPLPESTPGPHALDPESSNTRGSWRSSWAVRPSDARQNSEPVLLPTAGQRTPIRVLVGVQLYERHPLLSLPPQPG